MSIPNHTLAWRKKELFRLRSLSMPHNSNADPFIFNKMTDHMIEQLKKGILYSPNGYTSQINHKSIKRKHIPNSDHGIYVSSNQSHIGEKK